MTQWLTHWYRLSRSTLSIPTWDTFTRGSHLGMLKEFCLFVLWRGCFLLRLFAIFWPWRTVCTFKKWFFDGFILELKEVIELGLTQGTGIEASYIHQICFLFWRPSKMLFFLYDIQVHLHYLRKSKTCKSIYYLFLLFIYCGQPVKNVIAQRLLLLMRLGVLFKHQILFKHQTFCNDFALLKQ